MSASDWVFLALGVQMLLVAGLARSAVWRASGWTALISLGVIYSLWRLTNGGQTSTEAWLVLSSLPLVALGAFFWQRPLGKLAMGLGVVLTVALLLTWRWADAGQAAGEDTAIIVYSVLVLIAMTALFMIAGVIGMRVLVERDRAAQQRLKS